MKKICALSLFVLLFSSCDYFVYYRFIIINDTTHDLVIKTSSRINDNEFYFSDTIHIVKSGKQIEFHQDFGIRGKNFIPDDLYLLEDTIPNVSKFDIYVNGKLQRKLRLREYWNYESMVREGKYTLHVVTENLEK